MSLHAVSFLYGTPDLPGPVMIPMWVSTWEGDDAYAFRGRAERIAELVVQATLQRYAVRANWDDIDDVD